MGNVTTFAILVVVFFSGLPSIVRSQCDESPKRIAERYGKIHSPSFSAGGEYGKRANCKWEFNPRKDGKEYALVLTVTQLKLYVVKNGKKQCLGSYNLTINQGQIQCDKYVHGTLDNGKILGNYFCNAYYSSPTCVNVSQIQGCETKQQKQTPYPVPVSYFSDGRNDPNVEFSSMYFKIGYKFIVCPKVLGTPETTHEPDIVTTASITGGIPSNMGPTTGVVEMTIIIATSTAGGVVLLMIIGLTLLFWKRKRNADSLKIQGELTHPFEPPGLSHNITTVNSNLNNQSESPNKLVQIQTAQSPTGTPANAANNRIGTETQQKIYANIPKPHKIPKSAQAFHAASTSKAESHLFPTAPRQKNPQTKEILKRTAENSLDFESIKPQKVNQSAPEEQYMTMASLASASAAGAKTNERPHLPKEDEYTLMTPNRTHQRVHK